MFFFTSYLAPATKPWKDPWDDLYIYLHGTIKKKTTNSCTAKYTNPMRIRHGKEKSPTGKQQQLDLRSDFDSSRVLHPFDWDLLGGWLCPDGTPTVELKKHGVVESWWVELKRVNIICSVYKSNLGSLYIFHKHVMFVFQVRSVLKMLKLRRFQRKNCSCWSSTENTKLGSSQRGNQDLFTETDVKDFKITWF